MQQLSRQELERVLEGLTDVDARRRLEPMNCISWIIGHVAAQQHALFVAQPAGKGIDSRYKPYGFGSQTTKPPLDEVMELWRDSCREADPWLHSATDDLLQQTGESNSPRKENYGTLLVRHIFHIWYHIGEISSIRQILGHKSQQFVNMHEWSFGSK